MRWRDVSRYMRSIRVLLETLPVRAPSIRALTSSAFKLPPGVQGQIHFVADLPCGNMSPLRGGSLREVIPSILKVYPKASISFVVRREVVEQMQQTSPCRLRVIPLKGGRAILRT